MQQSLLLLLLPGASPAVRCCTPGRAGQPGGKQPEETGGGWVGGSRGLRVRAEQSRAVKAEQNTTRVHNTTQHQLGESSHILIECASPLLPRFGPLHGGTQPEEAGMRLGSGWREERAGGAEQSRAEHKCEWGESWSSNAI